MLCVVLVSRARSFAKEKKGTSEGPEFGTMVCHIVPC